MRIAMFLKDENMRTLNAESMRVLIFSTKDDAVTGMEEHRLYNKNPNYLSVWLLNKQIDIIYIREADENVVNFFRKMDISVKSYEDLKDNQFLRSFLL
ncbi:MAG: hypothetical protein E6772_16950 [Dysgonomonas sp.]|nr:hypothetical protein [Dysgonomonas sp.]